MFEKFQRLLVGANAVGLTVFTITCAGCNNNSKVESVKGEETSVTIGGSVVVSRGTFDNDVEIEISAVEGMSIIPSGKAARSSELRVIITDAGTGEIEDTNSAAVDITVTLETEKIADVNGIEVLVLANPGGPSEESYTIPNDELTIESLGGSLYKVIVLTRETNAVFVVIVPDGNPPSPTSSPSGTPTNISLSNQAITEKSGVGSLIGEFTTTDSDSDTHIYSLVSGTGSGDNNSFTISGNKLNSAFVFDYEIKSSYSVRIRSTDSDENYLEKSFTILVTDLTESWEEPVLLEVDNDGGAVTPQIASDGNGNMVAVWSQNDGTRDNIRASVYSSSSGWGSPELLESDNTSHAQYPKVVMDNSGNAVAVWMQHDGTRFNILANRYSSGSGWGTAELIESDNNGHAQYPNIDIDSSGNVLAVWQHSDGTRDNIQANLFTVGSGWGAAALIETDTSGPASDQYVKFDRSGNAMAIWKESDGTRTNIRSNYYTAGSGWGSAGLVESNNAGPAQQPKVAFNSEGEALAVWSHSDGTRYNIMSNIYQPGMGWGAAALIETDDNGSAQRPYIAVDSSDNALAVWHQSDGSVLNIWANYYTVNVGWGAAATVETDNSGNALNPRIGFDSSGNAIAVWAQFDATRYNIWANHFDAGTGWGTAELIEENNDGDSLNPELIVHQNSDATAVWSTNDGTRHNIWSAQFQ